MKPHVDLSSYKDSETANVFGNTTTLAGHGHPLPTVEETLDNLNEYVCSSSRTTLDKSQKRSWRRSNAIGNIQDISGCNE